MKIPDTGDDVLCSGRPCPPLIESMLAQYKEKTGQEKFCEYDEETKVWACQCENSHEEGWPNIYLEFEQGTSKFSITSEDYLLFDATSQKCFLKLREGYDEKCSICSAG